MNRRLLMAFAAAICGVLNVSAQPFRPPSVPLVTFDPYLSIWSAADRLTDRPTQHWTKRPHPLIGLIRVDGQNYRVMGSEPATVPALPQVGLQVTPTRSIYDFENSRIHLTLTFMRPALPQDLDAMALPLNYVVWQVRSRNGEHPAVAVFESTSAMLAVNSTNEPIEWARESAGSLTCLRAGTVEQPVLATSGDDHRINWGYAYAAAPSAEVQAAIGASRSLLESFTANGCLPAHDDTRMPRPAGDEPPAMAFVFDLGPVSETPVERRVIVAYDEVYAIKYFGRKLAPYWRRNGATFGEMLQQAARDYPRLAQQCAEFDAALMADAERAGGEEYARLCALAYRQCAAACGLAADANKCPLFFTKENTSNGDIATVDVFFPMDPQWLLLSPTLAKASLVPILSYASSTHWKFANAPHDLGTYPIARGTDDGGEGMPVEESGNMLILCDAVAQAEGNTDFVSPWWPKLTQWAEYLKQYGLDPEDQLCTDDFMGHLAHNANLSIKAILGLACYADLCQRRGDADGAATYRTLAKADAAHWIQAAADGDHYRLAFDKPNTWSQKYNLVWDRILGLEIFPATVSEKEVAYYLKARQRYGLPLDSRTKLTKTDWSVWSASLAGKESDFEQLVAPIYNYLNETSARSPFADSYLTDDFRSDGMHARPVIGGVFIKLLTDRALWQKWARADRQSLSGWAPLPEPPQVTEIVPTARKSPGRWRYTMQPPAAGWTERGFDDSTWKLGLAGFGTKGTVGAIVNTRWDTSDIWLRRDITLPEVQCANLQFYLHHDEDVEVYVNGVLAAKEAGFTTTYVPLEIRPEARALLLPRAAVTLAVHCHQTVGGQNVDVGLANITEPRP